MCKHISVNILFSFPCQQLDSPLEGHGIKNALARWKFKHLQAVAYPADPATVTQRLYIILCKLAAIVSGVTGAFIQPIIL